MTSIRRSIRLLFLFQKFPELTFIQQIYYWVHVQGLYFMLNVIRYPGHILLLISMSIHMRYSPCELFYMLVIPDGIRFSLTYRSGR
jgi:hypothetical protein